MAFKPGKMAELNNDRSTIQFAAAVTAMSIGTGKRLIRNFQYYRQDAPKPVAKWECLRIFYEIRLNIFGLQNLYLESTHHHNETWSSYKVMLSKQIQDAYEELHRKLLFFDANVIADLIPVLDRQRSFWADSTDPEFYSSELPEMLDHHLTSDFPTIENHLQSLPECSNS